MKILTLTMNAFLTYKDKTTIHFDQLLDHGIYLISGTTGSGKTTIFDAITFALYGVASGSQRNPTHFRSDFADVKDETYVELEFELHHQMYKIKRSPTYTRPGYKTPKMANAILYINDEIIEGVKEVNLKISQLLGVDVHQFKQIVMIAQGEFTKLIYASSEEREKVLRHIFHSEGLVDFENILKEQTKNYKEQYQLSSQKLQSLFQLLNLSHEFMQTHQSGFHPQYIEEAKLENQKLQDEFNNNQSLYKTLTEKYNTLSQQFYKHQQNNQDILEYEKTSQNYQELLIQEAKYKDLENLITKLKHIQEQQSFINQYQTIQTDINSLLNQTQTYQQSIQQHETELTKLKHEYENIPQYRKDKEQLIIELKNIEQTLQTQNLYHLALDEYHQEQVQYKHLKTQYQESLTHHQKLLDRIERDQNKISKLPTLQLELKENETMVQEMNKKRVTIHELSELYDEFKNDQDTHYELSKRYKEAHEQYTTLLHHYQQEDENYKRQQAGILALDLKDNTPCPVCGSLHHPSPAKLSLQVLSTHELEELNEQVNNALTKKESLYQDTLLQKQKLTQIQSQIDLLKKQLNITDELSKHVFIVLLRDIMNTIHEHELTYQKKHDEVEYLNKLKNSLQQDQLLYKQQQEDLEQLQQDLFHLESSLSSKQTKIEEWKQDAYIQDENLNDTYQHKTTIFHQLEQKIEDIDHNYHTLYQELVVVRTKLQESSLQLEAKQQTYEDMSHQFNTWMKEYFETQEEYQNCLEYYPKLSLYEKQLQDYQVQKRTYHMNLKALEEKVQGLQWTDLSSMQETLNIQEEKRHQVLKTINQLDQTVTQNQKILKQLEKAYQNNQDIFEQYTLYQDLSDVSSGKNNQRMTFERYVLSSYFEHILEYANIELLKMSQGRYAMYRKKETKGSKQQGLDLSVLDYETGIMRDIQSLSGGESFKAALALALGLSSMIQSYAGGIELNTLFIDEGFGSLDSESLDQALSVLLDLKNDNKVIGIISHVHELKERISAQIIVEKTSQGSRVHIE